MDAPRKLTPRRSGMNTGIGPHGQETKPPCQQSVSNPVNRVSNKSQNPDSPRPHRTFRDIPHPQEKAPSSASTLDTAQHPKPILTS